MRDALLGSQKKSHGKTIHGKKIQINLIKLTKEREFPSVKCQQMP